MRIFRKIMSYNIWAMNFLLLSFYYIRKTEKACSTGVQKSGESTLVTVYRGNRIKSFHVFLETYLYLLNALIILLNY